jgi:hypothetical protein
MEMKGEAETEKCKMGNVGQKLIGPPLSTFHFSLRRHFTDLASITRTESFAPGDTLP